MNTEILDQVCAAFDDEIHFQHVIWPGECYEVIHNKTPLFAVDLLECIETFQRDNLSEDEVIQQTAEFIINSIEKCKS